MHCKRRGRVKKSMGINKSKEDGVRFYGISNLLESICISCRVKVQNIPFAY